MSNIIKETSSVYLSNKVRELKRAGSSIIEFQIGEPEIETSEIVKSSCINAIEKNRTKYSHSYGLSELRERISVVKSHEQNRKIKTENILITHGAVHGIKCVLESIISYGDEVLIIEPAWPTVKSQVVKLGGKPIVINSYLESNLILNEIEKYISVKTKAIYINTPNNPTSIVLQNKTINDIVSILSKRNIYVLFDSVYEYYNFNDPRDKNIEYFKYKNMIYFNSFSKKYCMTGFRVGYIIASKKLIKRCALFSQISITNVPEFSQVAALTSLSDKNVEKYCFQYKEKLKTRSEYLNQLLSNNDIQYFNTHASFYKFIKLGAEINDCEFSNSLLDSDNVCVVPGSSYGETGRGYIRISYTCSMKNIKLGMNKIIKRIKLYKKS